MNYALSRIILIENIYIIDQPNYYVLKENVLLCCNDT